ncbi:MAG: 50S ribosomal protein L4 [Syntrophales bacterium]|nr:50S ribosomal protein L4 [Syntrophales bacterium]
MSNNPSNREISRTGVKSMPTVEVYNTDRQKVSEIELSDAVFGGDVNQDVIYEVVRMQHASRRRGTSKTKGRSEVRGGGRKPWRQKGTGRARAGTRRSPLWRGGGVVFGPQPRTYSFKVPRKVRRRALISALSMKYRENLMFVLKDFPMDAIKTKKFKEVMDRFGWGKTLFVIDQSYPVLEMSSRNLKNVKMIRSEGINVYDLLDYRDIVFLEPSVKKIEGVLLA